MFLLIFMFSPFFSISCQALLLLWPALLMAAFLDFSPLDTEVSTALALDCGQPSYPNDRAGRPRPDCPGVGYLVPGVECRL